MDEKKKNIILPLGMVVIFLLLCFVSISIGVMEFSFQGLIQGKAQDIMLATLTRVPRLVSVLITGINLSVAGLILQSLTRNKFVSPSTIGIFEWGKLGILIAILCFGEASPFLKTFVAFIVTFIGSFFFIMLLMKLKIKEPAVVPLLGMILSGVIGSITTFIAYNTDLIQNVQTWLLGTFSGVIKGNYETLYLGLPLLIVAYVYADKFTIAGMGDSMAKNLGINPQLIIIIGLSIVAFIVSTTIATVGSVPFLGLIIPNMVSIYKGDDVKGSLFTIAFSGAFFLLLCDTLARIIVYPYEMSVSVIIGVLGSIIFLCLVVRRARGEG